MSQILIAIGANLPGPDGAPPLETCRRALAALAALPGLRLEAASAWYETAPVPPSAQPFYVNGVARLSGDAEPASLLAALQAIEREAGRQRAEPNAPRTLDLDVLAIDGLVREGPDPVVPHPRMRDRAFVLIPLRDVAPDWVDPVTGRSVESLIVALPLDHGARRLPPPPPIRCEQQGALGLITLLDPVRRNVLDHAMLAALQRALAAFEAARCRAVVLRVERGTRVFCAGHDINELQAGVDPLLPNEPLQATLRAIRAYPGAMIAMVRGSVWGGGFDLVCSCDLVLADPSASFAITPANLGLPYNVTGLLHLQARLPLNLLKEMFFTAAPIDAERARACHVINHLHPADRLEEETLALARRIAEKAPLAVRTVKEVLRTVADEAPLTVATLQRLEALRQLGWAGADFAEGLAAFRAKRPPHFQGQ